MPRHAHIVVDLDAIRSNTTRIVASAPESVVCAVVKADGYGHGAVPAARAALDGGAGWLAVAMVEEGVSLRSAGIEAPILLLSEVHPDTMEDALVARLTPTLYTVRGVEAAAAAVRNSSGDVSNPWTVHLKVDTGMHRVGALPGDALGVARAIDESVELSLGGVFTHLAVADDPARTETAEQLASFDKVIAEIRSAGIDPGILHSANSAGTLLHRESQLDLVRVGISLYGYPPAVEVGDSCPRLTPALSLVSEVSMVKNLEAGDGVGYGLRHVTDSDTRVAVVPLGYADGIDRRFGLLGGVVLIRGRRCEVRGVVTMDQLVAELPPDLEVSPGDEVMLLGTQGGETITADDWAELLGTISYEVLCRFGSRLPRVYRSAD